MEKTVSRVRLMMANLNRGSKAAEDFLQGNDQVCAGVLCVCVRVLTSTAQRDGEGLTWMGRGKTYPA